MTDLEFYKYIGEHYYTLNVYEIEKLFDLFCEYRFYSGKSFSEIVDKVIHRLV